MSAPPDVDARFAALPEWITRRQIAGAAGVSLERVNKWVRRPGFPASVRRGGPGCAELRHRDLVAVWVRGVLCETPDRPGPKRREVSLAALGAARVAMGDIAQALGVSRRAAQYYADAYADFPVAGPDSLRDGAAVVGWFAGHVPGRRGGVPSDGPTARDREVLAVLDRAAAEGRSVTARELAAELGVHVDSARRLLRRVAASGA